MERLTEWRGEHAVITNHHENYIDRLAAYEGAEEQGLLVRLPCAVGDTVWGIIFDTRDCSPCRGIGGCFGCSAAEPIDVYRQEFHVGLFDKIGKTLFLTREEAESALKGERKDV